MLKLIMTYEKKYKIIFLWKKMRPKSVFLQSRKTLQVLEKTAFQKKDSSSLFVKI